MSFIKNYRVTFGQDWMRIDNLDGKESVIRNDNIGGLCFCFCSYSKALATKATFIRPDALAPRGRIR